MESLTKNHRNSIKIILSSNAENIKKDYKCLFDDFSDNCYWISQNIQNSSIELSFVPNAIKLFQYSLTIIENYCSPTEWIFEGSFDGIHYKTLEYHSDNQYMCTEYNSQNECLKNKPYSGSTQFSFAASFIKLTMLGKRKCAGTDQSGIYYALPLANIELRGLFLKNYFKGLCPKSNNNLYHFISILTFINIIIL